MLEWAFSFQHRILRVGQCPLQEPSLPGLCRSVCHTQLVTSSYLPPLPPTSVLFLSRKVCVPAGVAGTTGHPVTSAYLLHTCWGLCPVSRSPNLHLSLVRACSPEPSYPASLQEVSDMGCQAIFGAGVSQTWTSLVVQATHTPHVPSLPLCVSCGITGVTSIDCRYRKWKGAQAGVGPGRGGASVFLGSSRLTCDCRECHLSLLQLCS